MLEKGNQFLDELAQYIQLDELHDSKTLLMRASVESADLRNWRKQDRSLDELRA